MLHFLNGGSYPLFVVRGIVSKKAGEIFLGSLRNMQRRGLITYRETWIIIDKYDNRRIATTAEITTIEQMHTEALSEVGCKHLAMIFKSPKRYQAFSEKFHKKISKQWRTAFKVIEVRASAEICALYQNIPIDQLKSRANQELSNAVLKKIHQLKTQQESADHENNDI